MSFSAEIKDFVAGFKAGADVGNSIQERKLAREKYESDKALDAEKMGFAKLKFQDAKVRADRSLGIREAALADRKDARAARAAERAAEKARKAADKVASDEVKSYEAALPDTPKATKPAKAVPVDEYEDDTEDLTVEDPAVTDLYEDDDVAEFKRGGMVLHAAEGTKVPDEEEASAIPVTPPKPKPRPTQEATPAPVEQDGKGDLLIEEAKVPIRDVFATWTEESKEKPSAVDTKPQKSQARVSDARPASPSEIQAIDQTIDPNGELQSWVKGAARLTKAYNHFIEQGQPDKARKIAAQIIKHDQLASMTLGKLAQEALQQGDLVSASRLITDAYNENVPDGGQLSAEPTPKGTVLYKIDRSGKTIQEGEATTQQLWQMAGKIADGSEFVKRMARIAAEGDTSQGNPPAGETKPEGGSKKPKRSYSADVASAAKARKELDAAQDAYDNAEEEDEKRTLYAELKAKTEAFDAAMEQARKAAKKTKRDDAVLSKDFNAALKLTGEALPTAPPPEPPKDDRNWWERNMPSFIGGDDAPTAEAVPTEPAPAPAAQQSTSSKPEASKVVNGKTYVKINGKWFEQK